MFVSITVSFSLSTVTGGGSTNWSTSLRQVYSKRTLLHSTQLCCCESRHTRDTTKVSDGCKSCSESWQQCISRQYQSIKSVSNGIHQSCQAIQSSCAMHPLEYPLDTVTPSQHVSSDQEQGKTEESSRGGVQGVRQEF